MGIVVRGRDNVVVVVNRSLRRKKVQRANALKGKGKGVHEVFQHRWSLSWPKQIDERDESYRCNSELVPCRVPSNSRPPRTMSTPTARNPRCSFLKHPTDRLRFRSTSGPFSGVVSLFEI